VQEEPGAYKPDLRSHRGTRQRPQMRKSESYTKPTKADANGPESMIAFTFTCKEEHLFASIADIEARRTANQLVEQAVSI
jgi:hypothetical protein